MSNPSKSATNPGGLSTIIDTNQQLLIRNLKQLMQQATLKNDSYETLVNPGLGNDTDARLWSYWGPPEDMVSKMIHPPEGKAFIHATPAQLSILQPLLRFFLVNNEGAEEEIYFSEYTSEAHLDKLAALRRENGDIDGLNRQRGANVGVKQFSWEYHNKHEGDRIVQASLDLYFGSLGELVNENYLKFLFTNGLKSPDAAPLGQETGGDSLDDRLQALLKEIELKTPFLRPDASTGKFSTKPAALKALVRDKIKGDFRQLKVAVGWSVPKGQRQELMRLFRGGETTSATAAGNTPSGQTKKLKSFLQGVKGTQKILLLNLRTYDVEFNQNGTVRLNIQYVASTDNYLSNEMSDVLGGNNFSSGNLNERQVQIRRDLLDGSKIWPKGYLGYQFQEAERMDSTGIYAYVRMDRLRMESDVLAAKLRHKEITNERDNRVGSDTGLAQLREWDKSVNDAYMAAKASLRYERYSQFLDRLIQTKSVWSMIADYDQAKNKVTLSGASKSGTTDRAAMENWLKKLTRLKQQADKEATKKALKSQAGKKEDNHFGVQAQGIPTYTESGTTQRKVMFARLGDIIKVGMELSQMRSDVNFLLGTWYPGASGVPGYKATADEYEMIYDIPISLEYFGQFFYKNVILAEKDEWPFRNFYMATLKMVTQILNRLTGYKLRIQFDWATFSTYSRINPASGIIDEPYLNQVRSNLNNEPYRAAKKVNTYYIMYAKQISLRNRSGNRTQDEQSGIYHYTLGASRGVAKEFLFKAQDVPQFQAKNIAAITTNEAPGALASAAKSLILPQDVDIEMIGNSLHRNGDLLYVDSRQALGSFANTHLTLGGYYRVVKSIHTISSAGYSTTLGCVFQRRTKG